MARGDLRPGELGRGSAMTVELSWMVDWGEWAGGSPWLERRKGQRFHVCILHLFIEYLLCAILLGAEEAQRSTVPSLSYETHNLVGNVEL